MAGDPESRLLSEALGVPVRDLELRSREPLGAGSVAGFEIAVPARAAPPDADAQFEGDVAGLYFVDTSGVRVLRETGLVLSPASRTDQLQHARIWQHPNDPHLPAFPSIAFPHALEALLARTGLEPLASAELVAYRPGRRAVFRVPCVQGEIWIKVVPPHRAERIRVAHEACAAAGVPVPDVRFWAPDGVLAFASARGLPAAEALADEETFGIDGLLDEVDVLMRTFAGVRLSRSAHSVESRLDWYASRAVEPRIEAIVGRIRQGLRHARGPRPAAVVHGDLHFGQLFLDERGRISGVVDVDTLGVGDSAEDPAAFMSHAIASAVLEGSGSSTVDGSVHRSWREMRLWSLADAAVERWADRPAVVERAAVHLLGHVLGAGAQAQRQSYLELLAASEALLRGESPSRGIGRPAR